MVLLFLPKLLSIILVWCKGPKEYGGFIRVTLSLLLEVLFSVLLAPVRMLFHTVFVVSAFLGWEVVWNSPQRDDDSTPWGSLYAPRLAAAAGAGVGGRDGMAGSTLPVLAGADCCLADPLAVRIGDFQPGDSGPAHQALEAVPDPEEYSPPQVLKDTDAYLTMNRQRSLDDGFMHAVFNPSFNALATAMATARHRQGHILEIARERHVEQALNETPDKLNRDRRLVLLSDPVTMSRLHYRVWAAPEKYSSWVNAYQQLALNPLALKTK